MLPGAARRRAAGGFAMGGSQTGRRVRADAARRLVAWRSGGWLWLALALAVACGGSDAGRGGKAPSDGLPALGTVPSFDLVDQDGKPFGSADLRGQVWIADFIFTRCPGMCPMLTNQMVGVQRELAKERIEDRIHLVSFSVDPEHDTPAVLARYAAEHDAESGKWTFLTGSRDAIWKLSSEGFKLAVGERPPGSENPLLHSDKFVLVDHQGRIRGYYSPLEASGRDQLMADVAVVLDEAERDGALYSR
jgi:protein SCO1/2